VGAIAQCTSGKKVYRKELRPVLTRGARAMNTLFDERRA
jgi:hypothetical protein